MIQDELNHDLVKALAKLKTPMAGHLLRIYDLVLENDCQVVVECGAGQSSFAFAAALRQTHGQLWSIDIEANAHLRMMSAGRGFLEMQSNWHYIVADDMEVLDYWDKPIDLLFIDTVHDYEHTMSELKGWHKWAKMIVMHDTENYLCPDCRRAMDDFLKEHPEFKLTHYPESWGLSILRLEV